MDLSIVIVNWNTRDDLGRCLLALRPAAAHLALQVVVVDNASSDGSAALVARRFPEAEVLALRRNLGFAAANNLGLARCTGRYQLLLNPDCLVHAGALEELVADADAHPEAGLLGPRLLNGDGSLQYSCRSFPTPAALLLRNTFFGRILPRNPWVSGYLMSGWHHDQPRNVDWISGACLMVRADARAQFGDLDDSFFMYCEDMDWCLRAWRAGWQVRYVPGPAVTHLVGRSSDRRPVAMTVEHHRSMLRYVRKHYGRVAAALAAPLIAARLAAVLWLPARAR